MDEWKGRSVTQSRSLPLTGAIGVIGIAYQNGFIENPLGVLQQMRSKGFRVSDQVAATFQNLLRTKYKR